MSKVVVTGAEGFVGSHVQYFLFPETKAGTVTLVPLTKETFADDAQLTAALKDADIVIHLAGMNRGDDTEVYETNIALAKRLVTFLETSEQTPAVAYTSSTHIERDSAYGRSKKEAGEILSTWAANNSATVASLVLPNIFGEFANPKYNSAVATFCSQIANGEESSIAPGAEIELVYVGDAVHALYEAALNKVNGLVRVEGEKRTVADVYALLKNFNDIYAANRVPTFASRLDQHLFMTLHSFLFHKNPVRELELKSDQRGSLFELVRHDGEGQTFYSNTVPGAARGQHYHTRKLERFCVVKGEGTIVLRKLLTQEVIKIPVSGLKPVVVDMPTYYTHALKNTGSEDLFGLFWINEQYNPDDPDTFREEV